MSETCSRCKFYKDVTGPGGLCRRYAPSPTVEGADPVWPWVNSGDWCGEWSGKVEPATPVSGFGGHFNID